MYSNTWRFFRQPLSVIWTLSSPQIFSRVRVSWSDQGVFLLWSDRRRLADGCSSKRRSKFIIGYCTSKTTPCAIFQRCEDTTWTLIIFKPTHVRIFVQKRLHGDFVFRAVHIGEVIAEHRSQEIKVSEGSGSSSISKKWKSNMSLETRLLGWKTPRIQLHFLSNTLSFCICPRTSLVLQASLSHGLNHIWLTGHSV